MLEWINLGVLLLAYLLFAVLYNKSIQPMKRKEKRGEVAWKECAYFRSMSGLFEFIIVLCDLLWIWVPVLIFGETIDAGNMWVGITVGLAITIPGAILMSIGIKDAGKETLTPSADTQLYRGIYRYIRHPQSLGEFPMFIAMGFFVNSWFLVIIAAIFCVTYIPIMIHYEEQDLVKRFGQPYIEYRRQTGALFPKLGK